MLDIRICDIDAQRQLADLDLRLRRLPLWRQRNIRSLRNAIDRLQSIAAFELLQEMLIENYGTQIDSEFSYNEYGKPSLTDNPEIHFSMSHCPKAAMVIIADTPVGCDVEMIPDAVPREIVDYCFSENEQGALTESAQPEIEFTKIWTRKEAIFKLDNTLEIENIDTTAFASLDSELISNSNDAAKDSTYYLRSINRGSHIATTASTIRKIEKAML